MVTNAYKLPLCPVRSNSYYPLAILQRAIAVQVTAEMNVKMTVGLLKSTEITYLISKHKSNLHGGNLYQNGIALQVCLHI